MPINPNIALATRPVEIADPMAMYGKIAAIQSAQNQNALAQYQLGAAQRQEAATNALSKAYQEAYDPQTGGIDRNRLRQSLATGGFGAQIPTVEKALGELDTQALARQKTEADLFDTSMKQIRNMWGNVRTPEEAIAVHDATHRDPIINKRLKALGITEEMGRQQILQAAQDPQNFAQFIQRAQLGAEKFMELNKPQLSTSDIGGQVVSRTFQPLTGKIKTVATQQKTMAPGEEQRLQNEAVRIKQEGQRIGLEGRRVAVMEETARRDADPGFQQRMSAARTVGQKAAEGDVAAQQALPRVISRAEEGVRLIDELIGKRDSKTGQLLKGEKPHPGFQNSVGATWLPGARFVPGTDAASFMSRFDQIKGASFLEAFESLKGGGAITEKEGQKATDAINRMSISSDEKEFVRAALDLQDVIRKGVENAQKRAARPGATAPAAPAAPAATGGVKFLGFEQ